MHKNGKWTNQIIEWQNDDGIGKSGGEQHLKTGTEKLKNPQTD